MRSIKNVIAIVGEMFMKQIRVGVIGVGNIGFMHARNLYENKVNGMKLTAVCDLDESRLELCNNKFENVNCYLNYEEMITGRTVDAVVIAVPHRLHAKIATEALHAGLHVLVEKPIDVTMTEAQKLIDVAKESKRIFAIMFNQRTNLLFQKARDIVQGGFLGELKRSVWIVTNWYRTQHYYDSCTWRATWKGEGGGVLLNQAPHNLDLWQWICGMPESVRGFCDEGKYHNIEVEDEATLFVRYKNGATGTFITTTGEYPGTNRLEIAGDRGKIVLENSTLKWWKLEDAEREFCYTSEKSLPKIDCDYQEFSFEEKESGHVGILQNFANAILNGETLISPGEDGLQELSLSNAAYLSAWSGNVEITFPLDNEKFDRILAEKSAKSICKEETVSLGQEEGQSRWQVRW